MVIGIQITVQFQVHPAIPDIPLAEMFIPVRLARTVLAIAVMSTVVENIIIAVDIATPLSVLVDYTAKVLAEMGEMAMEDQSLAEEARLAEVREAVMLQAQHILGVAGALIMHVQELLIQHHRQEQEAVILEEILAVEAINVREVQVVQEYAQ
jgi:hypothetical protein